MNDYLICTDSTCDLPESYYKEHGIRIICLTFTIEGASYLDNDTSALTKPEFYNKMRNGKLTSTSQVNSEDFIEKIEPLLKDGKDILFIAFSSGLSGSYQSSVLGANELREKYPDRKIIVIDSLCASMGEGLMVDYVIKNRKNGMSIEDNAKWVEENKLNLCHWVTVDSLNHLQRMGRISKTSALFGGLIGIKPIIHMDNEGKLTVVSKARGRAASLTTLVDIMEKTAINPKDQTVFISHADALEDAEIVAKKVEERLGVKTILINYIGPVIGSHAGPGTIALFFMGTER